METTVQTGPPEREPDHVTPAYGYENIVTHFGPERFEPGAPWLASCGFEFVGGVQDPAEATHTWTTERANVTCAACRKLLAPEPDGLTAEQIEMDRQATGLDNADEWEVIPAAPVELDDEDDIVPAPGCGHPMPPGVDCCVSTQAPAEVPVCLAASRHGGICGQPAPCDGSRHVEPAPVVDERRTVSLETLTPALLAEEEQRRRVEAREQGVSFEPIPAKAKVVVVARINGLLGGVWDTDADWMATRADLLVAMLRSASDLAADGEAELLMPTPDVLAALDGRPDAQLLTAPVHVLALDIDPGMVLAPLGRAEALVSDRGPCTLVGCDEGASCVVLVVDGKRQHHGGYARTRVRIPVAVTK